MSQNLFVYQYLVHLSECLGGFYGSSSSVCICLHLALCLTPGLGHGSCSLPQAPALNLYLPVLPSPPAPFHPNLYLPVLTPIFCFPALASYLFTGPASKFVFPDPGLQFLLPVRGLSLHIPTLSSQFSFTCPGLRFLLPVRGLNFHLPYYWYY